MTMLLNKFNIFILFAVLFHTSQGLTETVSLQYIQDLIIDMKNDFDTEIRSIKQENRVLREEVNYLKSANRNQSRNCGRLGNDKIQDKRGIIQSQSTSKIAFTAVLTPTLNAGIGKHHVFVYDRVVTNIGGAYNKNNGIFTAPKSGVYAFIWTIFAEGRHPIDGQFGEIITDLMINSHARGRSAVDTEKDSDDEQAMGFTIVQLTQGDVAYIRSATVPQGTFHQDYDGEWTFSGWQIS